jgi:hypothetical protein
MKRMELRELKICFHSQNNDVGEKSFVVVHVIESLAEAHCQGSRVVVKDCDKQAKRERETFNQPTREEGEDSSSRYI